MRPAQRRAVTFQTVRDISRSLPDADKGIHGTPALKLRGKLPACVLAGMLRIQPDALRDRLGVAWRFVDATMRRTAQRRCSSKKPR